MIDINWPRFKAKFNGREQEKFEQLSYLLFCAEHGNKLGIFRFKNQIGIETEPIEVEGIVTGFQAKYYESKLADNKQDILDSLEKAKNKNPALQKILIYTNQEFSESKKKGVKKPVYLTEIENNAKTLGLSIEWRQPSHFEKQLAGEDHQHTAAYFFGADNSLVDFLHNIQAHTAYILHSIQTDIRYQGGAIKIDREAILNKIATNPSQVIVLSGEGGSGKTAIIKELCERSSGPMYVFKASEFHHHTLGSIFSQFGPYSLPDFLSAHSDEPLKTIVIDSAEKLADIPNQDPFIEMLSALLKNDWKVIFTTRNSYLDDLRFQMIEVYRLPFEMIQLDILTVEELQAMADQSGFILPTDGRMLNLIRNPFYLGEYLQHSDEITREINIARFRELLWNKTIQHSSVRSNNIHILREQCFLAIARKRVETGNFFVTAHELDNNVLSQLVSDEIIQYEPLQSGYFITHDIYEEWALERIIERQFRQNADPAVFFSGVGSSLPIRRAFRSWLSEKLAESDQLITPFVNATFASNSISPFWKDELLVSVLLSDHSDAFFDLFHTDLLANDKLYLHKIIFLLRTACKEVDTALQKILQLRKNNTVSVAYVFTRPKGQGWKAAIQYLHQNMDQLVAEDLEIVVPFLSEWVAKEANGVTTRQAGLIAIHFYKLSETQDVYYPSGVEDGLLKIVLQSARELKNELSEINETLLAEPLDRRQPYDSLREMVLTKNHDNLMYVVTFPHVVLKLADISWYLPMEARHPFDSGGIGLEKYYSLRSHWHGTASALQTPIGLLFLVKPKEALDFVIDFTNKTAASYFASGYDTSVEDVEVNIDGAKYQQYASPGLWSMYRGNGSPVTPYLLQSLHMALEKYLLQVAETSDVKVTVALLKNILIKARSASITGVVTSVVLAHYEKLFDVAILLLANPVFMRMDNDRRVREDGVRSLYSIGLMMGGADKEFTDERLATCDEPHRKLTLENLALQYQYFRSEAISDEESERRTRLIQETIDHLYTTIPEGKESDEESKILRLLLTRIDRRKMNPKITEVDKGLQVEFNPTLDPDLKEMTEQSLKEVDDKFQYTAVKMWAINKFDGKKGADHYKQFDDNPQLVIQQTKELIEKLNDPNADFHGMMNYDIPGYTCAALIRNYGDSLNAEDREFCAQVVQHYATAPLRENYGYQIADGTEAAVNAIPFLYKYYPDDHDTLNLQLLFVLLDTYPIGEYKRICDYAVEAIRDSLFGLSPENACKIWSAYARLKPRFDDFIKNHKARMNRSYASLLEEFAGKHESEIQTEDLWEPVTDISSLGIGGADTVFQIFPADTNDPAQLAIIKQILAKWLKTVFTDSSYRDRDERDDYRLKMRFSQKFARFLIRRAASEAAEWTKPVVDAFVVSRETANFISHLVGEEDQLNTYETFWIIWKELYSVIKSVALKARGHNLQELIYNYLLAWPYWNTEAKSWRSLKAREARFFQTVAEEMGSHPAVLYSLSKFLNEIGSEFMDQGIYWIADRLERYPAVADNDLLRNTIYYLEVITRKYVYLNRTNIKTQKNLKDKLIVILNFLVSKASVNGYLLREEIM